MHIESWCLVTNTSWVKEHSSKQTCKSIWEKKNADEKNGNSNDVSLKVAIEVIKASYKPHY